MKITQSEGTVLNGVVLARDDETLRVLAPVEELDYECVRVSIGPGNGNSAAARVAADHRRRRNPPLPSVPPWGFPSGER